MAGELLYAPCLKELEASKKAKDEAVPSEVSDV